MIFRKASPHAAHQAANRKIETRRTVLALIVAGWGEIQDFHGFTLVPQHVLGDSVDLRVALAALLVMKPSRVSDAGQNQAVVNAGRAFTVSRQPGDGSD